MPFPDHASYMRDWYARRKAAGYVRVQPKGRYVRQPLAEIPSTALLKPGRARNLPAMFQWMRNRQAAKRKRHAQIVNRIAAERREKEKTI